MRESIVPVSAEDAVLPGPTANERSEEMTLTIPLKMRNFEELDGRLQKGEKISPAEMDEKYYPLSSDYAQVRAWLVNSGLTEIPVDGPHLSVFVKGSASQIAALFQVKFVKKHFQRATSLTSINAPSIPSRIAELILGVNGLQPHHTARTFDNGEIIPIGGPLNAVQPQASNGPPYNPTQINTAYSGNNLPNKGSGQMIAIIGSANPDPNDLNTYWSTFGISQSLNNIQYVQVPNTSGPADGNQVEWSLDVEWASSIASSSVVRFYNCTSLSNSNIALACQKIVSDLSSTPNLHQVSISFGSNENAVSQSFAQQVSNYFASMSANGVTVFVASGDSGSNPNGAGSYNASSPTVVSFPADSPYVTGVGGTALPALGSNGQSSGETAWSVQSSNPHGSGGGVSAYFTKPSWQVGQGVPSVNRRCVPDVAALGDPNTGGYVRYQGQWYVYGGTSLSAPIVAGVCARVNDARAQYGASALGSSFNPLAYKNISTSTFRDITQGSNGAYSAQSGYDLVTGVGVPSISTLFHSSISGSFFTSEVDVSGGFYYLKVPGNGNVFGYYNYINFPNIYHNEMGFEYLTSADANGGIYLYDYTSGHYFFTSPTYSFPYVYDFTLNATLYYYPQGGNPDHYTTNPRYFYNFSTSQIISQ